MSPTIPILLYHSVSDDPPDRLVPYTVSRSQLASHLDRVAERGYSTLTVSAMVQRLVVGEALPPRTAVITFDDGFADFSSDAWPEISARNMHATLYVVAGSIDGRSEWLSALGGGHLPLLSRQQLVELAADGCEIGSHSMTHPHLDCLPRSLAAQEIRQSKDVLEQYIGGSVESFAYPHGYHDREVKRLVAAAGFTSASGVRECLSHADDDRYALARVTVYSKFTLSDIDRILAGEGISRARRGERWRTRGWRYVRRWQYGRNHRTTV